MPNINASITQPNSPLLPLVSYSFNVSDSNSLHEVKEGIYTYLRFTETKNITEDIKGIFPAPGGKLNKAYPHLEFTPENSYFYKGIQHYETEWPTHMLDQIPPGMTLQPKQKQRMFVMKKTDNNTWDVLIF